jgi:hypothetical protein
VGDEVGLDEGALDGAAVGTKDTDGEADGMLVGSYVLNGLTDMEYRTSKI